MLRGSQALIELTLELSGGADGDYDLAVSGLPADVDATFSPATLSAGQPSGTLTLSAQATAVDGAHSLTITASGESLVAESELAVEVVSLTVEGRVMISLVEPLAGGAVSSQGSSTTTAPDGSFTLTGLSVPYDLTTVNTAEGYVHVFAGLTTGTPVVSSIKGLTTPSTDRSGTVEGALTGDLLPLAANEKILICVEVAVWVTNNCTEASGVVTNYSISPSWSGSETTAARLHVLKASFDNGGKPTGYSSYSVDDLTLTDASTTTVDLEPGDTVGSKTMLVEIESSAPTQTVVGAQFGDGLLMPLLRDGDGSKALAVILPVLPDVTYAVVHASSGFNVAWASELTGDPVKLVVPDAPTRTAPTTGATGVDTSTEFTIEGWTGPVTHFWYPNSSTGPSITLTSMASTVTIPDTSELGLPLPAATDYGWQLIALTGASVEAGMRPVEDFVSALGAFMFGSSSSLEGEGAVVLDLTAFEFTTAGP